MATKKKASTRKIGKKSAKRPARTRVASTKGEKTITGTARAKRKLGRLVFQAPLYQATEGKPAALPASGATTFLDLPADSSQRLGSKARVAVRGTINGFFFCTSVTPTGKGNHSLMVDGEMREGAKAGAGDQVAVVLEVDTSPRPLDVPGDLAAAIAASDAACERWSAFSPSCKKAYVTWITEARKAETRQARIEKALRLIAKGKPAR